MQSASGPKPKKLQPWEDPDFDASETCWRCLLRRAFSNNAIVFCDHCGYGVHQRCEGGTLASICPAENQTWYCKDCTSKSSQIRAKVAKLLANADPAKWSVARDDTLQLLEGPTPAYQAWVGSVLKRSADFLTVFAWFQAFGECVNLPPLNFVDLEALLACPTTSGLLADVHVKLLTCAGKRPTTANWHRVLRDFMEDNDDAFADAVRLSKELAAWALTEDAASCAAGELVIGTSLSVSDESGLAGEDRDGVEMLDESGETERVVGAAERKAVRAAKEAAKRDGFDEGPGVAVLNGGGEDEDEDDREREDNWQYFAQPLLVRVSLLRCLCEELLTLDIKANKRLADHVRVKVALEREAIAAQAQVEEGQEDGDGEEECKSFGAGRGRGAPRGRGRGRADRGGRADAHEGQQEGEGEGPGAEGLRGKTALLGSVPLYTQDMVQVGSMSDKPPMPAYMAQMATSVRGKLLKEHTHAPSPIHPGAPRASRIYHLPEYLAEAALSLGSALGATILPSDAMSGVIESCVGGGNALESDSAPAPSLPVSATVSMEMLLSPRRRPRRAMDSAYSTMHVQPAASSCKGGDASAMAPTSNSHPVILAIPRAVLAVAPLPLHVPPVHKAVNDVLPLDQRKKIQFDDDEGEVTIGDAEGGPPEKLDVEEKEEEKEEEEEPDLLDLPSDATDVRCCRYHFLVDSTNSFRLVRMRSDLPTDSIPRNLDTRRALVIRAADSVRRAVEAEIAAEKAYAAAVASAQQSAVKEAEAKEARKKAFFAASSASAAIANPANAAAVANASVQPGGAGTKRPAADQLNSSTSATDATATAATSGKGEKKAKSALAGAKGAAPVGQRTLFDMFKKPAATATAASAHMPTATPIGALPSEADASHTNLVGSSPTAAEAGTSGPTAHVHSGGALSQQIVSSVEEVVMLEDTSDTSASTHAQGTSDDMVMKGEVATPVLAAPVAVAAVSDGAWQNARVPSNAAPSATPVLPPLAAPLLPPLDPSLVYGTVMKAEGGGQGHNGLGKLSSVSVPTLPATSTLACTLAELESVIAELAGSRSPWERIVAKALRDEWLSWARKVERKAETAARRTKRAAEMHSTWMPDAAIHASNACSEATGTLQFSARDRGRVLEPRVKRAIGDRVVSGAIDSDKLIAHGQ